MKNSRILIIKIGALGDVVRITPVISKLYELGNTIDFSVDKEYESVIKYNNKVNNLFVLNRREFREKVNKNKFLIYNQIFRNIVEYVNEINKNSYDYLINFMGSEISIHLAGVINAKEKIGMCIKGYDIVDVYGTSSVKLRSILLNYEGARYKNSSQLTDIYFEMAGVNNSRLSCEVIPGGDSKIKSNNTIGIQVGAAWPSKKYSVQKWIELGNELIKKYNCDILLNGVEVEKEIVEEVKKGINGNVCVNYDLSDDEKINSLQNLKLFITADTGPMHVAAGLKVPVVALFGPTSITESAPYSEGNLLIKAKESCSPCFSDSCKNGKNCMDQIEVETVLSACEYILKGKDVLGKNIFITKFDTKLYPLTIQDTI